MEEARNDQKTSDIKVKRRKRKWLNAFGKFLMYGGFMLIIILGFIIYYISLSAFSLSKSSVVLQ